MECHRDQGDSIGHEPEMPRKRSELENEKGIMEDETGFPSQRFGKLSDEQSSVLELKLGF